MKIKFVCNNCFEKFNIEAKYLIKKVDVSCPNCSQLFSQDVIDQLKQLANNYQTAQSKLPWNDNLNHTFFDFSIVE